jgi:phosphate:Na+ symporter
MEGLSSLVLGLGLFFLGMQLVGENLRRLSGKSFRHVMQRVSTRPALAALAGVGFGALMQSATAVTFVLAGMQRSGLVTTHGAAPVILWCNVGLTALVFLATLNIHPLVAYFTGAAGILSALIRQSLWRSAAGGLLGVGLILFGLQSMSAGAAPLKSEVWFQALMSGAVSSAPIAFAVGILAAAILQSNTGAAMLIITLASAGEFDTAQAGLLIYGTNLGAIGLRFLLSMNLDSASKRLVRFEDTFCVWTGVVMVVLTFAELLGVPGPISLAMLIAPDSTELQLAVLFLLSNLLPAFLLAPFTGKVIDVLKRLIPESGEEAFSKPQFINETAVTDPGIAADLVLQESARLVGSLRFEASAPVYDSTGESCANPAFITLATAIERFLSRVSTHNRLRDEEAHAIHLLRSELGVIRYLEEAVREVNEHLHKLKESAPDQKLVAPMVTSLNELLALAKECAKQPTAKCVAAFRGASRKNHPNILPVRTEMLAASKSLPEKATAQVSAFSDSCDLTIWMFHRLAKVLERYASETHTQ